MRKYTHVKRVGCLLIIHYTVLNSFENKKGIIKIVSETLVNGKTTTTNQWGTAGSLADLDQWNLEYQNLNLKQ